MSPEERAAYYRARGLKAAATTRARYGDTAASEWGKVGGQSTVETHGAHMLAQWGQKGGLTPKKPRSKPETPVSLKDTPE